MKEERQVFYLSAVKKNWKEESVGTPGKGIFPVSCLFEIAWSDKRNCTSTETTETQPALCLKYTSGLNLKTGQRSVFYLVSTQSSIRVFFSVRINWHWYYTTCCKYKMSKRTLRSDDSDGGECVALKVNLRSFNVYRDYLNSLCRM